MPTYDYECPKGHRFEVFQRMTARAVASCPKCGARARRMISGGAGFLFKGEGFYITDSRSADYKKQASAESGAPSDKPEKAKPEGGSDAKSDGKAPRRGSRSKSTKAASED